MMKQLLHFKNKNVQPFYLRGPFLVLIMILLVSSNSLANIEPLNEEKITVIDLIDKIAPPTVDGGTITGGPFEFCVGDGVADNVYGVELECESNANRQWVVTDDKGNILGLPSTPEAVNFDGQGPGLCLIWHLSYLDGLEGLQVGNSSLTGLVGTFDFSNSIKVYRNEPEAGQVTGGPYNFTVGDGEADNVSGVELNGNSGANSQWVVTDETGLILGLPPTPEAVNFDGQGPGLCLIWHLSYADGLEGLEAGNNALTDLVGCYDLSDENIRVYREEAVVVDGGTLSEDPFFFCVGDGEADNVSLVSVEGAVGPNMQWIVTDETGLILGLPPTPEAVNFDGQGPGLCLIWHLSFADGLEGLAAGNNALTDLVGNYDLSDDNVRVYRNEPEAGQVTGGPYNFTVGDGEADNVSGVELNGNSGANSQWVVTDETGLILGLPPTPEAVNFDGQGPGLCLIWHLSYADGLEGLEAGNNALTDLVGCYDLSDENIRVYREEAIIVDGGNISGGPFEFCVGDGEADNVSGIELECESNANRQWVVTDDKGKILGLPPTPEAVDFDGQGPGLCLIWHLSFADGLEGLAAGNNALSDLVGNFDFSNSIKVYRNEPEAGQVTGGPYNFTVGDGEADNVSGVELNGNSGANSQWVVTDETGLILGLPPTPEAVNFDGQGPGLCLIWHLSYADGLEGLEAGNNALTDLVGCYDLSDENIRVYREEAVVVDGGTLSEDPFFFCVGDGEADNVSLVSVEGAVGPNMQWIVTDETGLILGLPPTPEAVNFDGQGPGLCLIWHLSFADGLEGLAAGNNALTDLVGNYDLSDDNVRVYRSQPEAGQVTGGPYNFTVGDGEADNVSGIELNGNSGANSQWVVTDETGLILGLPPTPEAVNFDGQGPGLCLIWHLSYADGLEGLAAGNNALTDLVGCYDLSGENVRVYREEAVVVDGGTLDEDSFFFCVGDGEADNVSLVSVEGAVGPNMQWIVTDETGLILGLPPTPEAVNFDGQGPGLCLIWHLSYADGLEGLAAGNNALTDLVGTYDLSDDNVRVYRNQPEAGDVTGGPYTFTVGDGEADNVSGVELSGNSGANSQWVVTDETGLILGLPPTPEAVNFDGQGPGLCLIWHLSYADGLQGLEVGKNALIDLYGCYDLSDEAVEVVRAENTTASKTSTSAKLFPMPANRVINVSSELFGTNDVEIRLVSLAGTTIKNNRELVNGKKISINVESVPSGLYILQINDSKGNSITKKVIIE